jgi:hypothetical protein
MSGGKKLGAEDLLHMIRINFCPTCTYNFNSNRIQITLSQLQRKHSTFIVRITRNTKTLSEQSEDF